MCVATCLTERGLLKPRPSSKWGIYRLFQPYAHLPLQRSRLKDGSLRESYELE